MDFNLSDDLLDTISFYKKVEEYSITYPSMSKVVIFNMLLNNLETTVESSSEGVDE